jgi:hypothetical protein
MYGVGHVTKRNVVLSREPLPRHHPEYDTFDGGAEELRIPASVCAEAERHLQELDALGARCVD